MDSTEPNPKQPEILRSPLALQVPSAVAPHHVNYLLNPAHPEFASLTIATPERFALDPRLLSPHTR
jgi:RES domain-containing protein